jgi:hypothetical protein
MPERGTFALAALRAAVAFAAMALLLALAAPRAEAFIYWANTQSQTIGRANNDGSGVNDSFISTGAAPTAVAVNSTHIYWVNLKSESIGRAEIDGNEVDNNFITGVKEPDGIAVNGSSIFWSTIPGPIGRADLNGSNVNKEFITAASQPCGLALDSGHVYWANQSLSTTYIGRIGLDGNFPQPEYVKLGVAFPCGVAVNSSNIFWADFGFLSGGTRIGRSNISGEGVDLSFIAGASQPCGVALDSSSHLYWANAEANTIGRANTDGTSVNQSFVATGSGGPCGVAVDALSSPPPPVPPAPPADRVAPQTTISAGPGRKLGKGIARFSFRSSEAGSTFSCRLDRRKPTPCHSPKRYVRLKPGRHTFRVWAADAAGNRDATPAKQAFRVPKP